MKIIKKYNIKNESDLIFAKHDAKRILKEYDFFENYFLALMELGTNLYKHAGSGELWLIDNDNSLLIASLDKGKGIENLNWALKKGSTSLNNSLGLGLYALKQIKGFKFEIFSKKNFGSIFLFGKNIKSDAIFFQIPFYDESVTGDFFLKKGKMFIIADVSGHGIKAYKSSLKIKEFFNNELISCVIIDDLFKELHQYIKKLSLRSVVLSIVENLKDKVNICGVGNINIFYKSSTIKYYTQAKGMVGEIFSDVSKFTFNKKNSLVVLKTDGISDKIVKMFLEKNYSKEMIAIGSIFYSEKNDDKSILIIGEENEGI